MTIERFEVLSAKDPLDTLVADIVQWQLYGDSEGKLPNPALVKRIIAHPLCKQFKVAKPVIYRSFVVEGKFTAKDSPVTNKGVSKIIVPYSEWKGIGEMVATFDKHSLLTFKKKLNPADVLVNLSAMTKYLLKNKKYANEEMTEGEKEIWMKFNPYYTTFQFSELVVNKYQDSAQPKKEWEDPEIIKEREREAKSDENLEKIRKGLL